MGFYSIFSSMMEFAPVHAGLVFAISNTVSNLSGFLAPISKTYYRYKKYSIVDRKSKNMLLFFILATGRLISGENTGSGWQLAFWISAIINVPGLIAFQIFGTDEIQSWAQ
jgi:hypothetical protein